MIALAAVPTLFVSGLFLLTPLTTLSAEPNLRVSLSSDRSTLTMKSAVTFNVMIENVSETPIWIFGDRRWGYDGGLMLNVGPWSDDGPLPFIIDHDTFMAAEVRPDVLVRLNPHIFLGRERTMLVQDLVRHPGTYRLWVEYRSPIPSTAFTTSFWASERGSIFSPALVLHVNRERRPRGNGK